MRKNGFTLIELLAVIVILAIIALIATPIILGIINDAREKANERSVELYASAVRNAIASYQLTNPTAPTKFSDLDVQYDGEVECEKQELYADGSFYITECTVNGVEVEYTYGEKQYVQVYNPQYYYFGFDFSGGVGTTFAPTNPLSVPPTGEILYLGYDVTDGVITAAYACFRRNEMEYCLKGNDTSAYTINTEILKDAYSDVLDAETCFFVDGRSDCDVGGLNAGAESDGYVYVDSIGYVSESVTNAHCYVHHDGDFGCYE